MTFDYEKWEKERDERYTEEFREQLYLWRKSLNEKNQDGNI